jgi:hypothetical protein
LGGRFLTHYDKDTPPSYTVSPNGAVAVSGRYSDSFAQSKRGERFIDVSDSRTLRRRGE